MRWSGLRAVAALVLITVIPARAEFHFAVIDEVMSGCGGDPTMQYVEIRMLTAGQNVVGDPTPSRLTAFSCDGSTINQLALIGSNVSNGMAGARWIMASPGFQAAAGIAADFSTLDATPGIFPDCGQVCWGKPGTQQDSPGAYVDCLAYGPYTGPKGSSAQPATDIPNAGSQSLTRAGGGAFDNNFALAAPSPTNNAGQTGNLSACSPVSTTTTVAGATTSTAVGGGSTTSTVSGGGTTSTTIGPALRGGGAAKTDCFAEWRVAGATGTTPVVTCVDNDPTCDSSPTAGCVIRTQLCFNDAAASVYGGKCAASPVTAFSLGGNPDATTAGAIATALSALPGSAGSTFSPPLSAPACTGPIELTVPLKVKGTKIKKGSLTIKSIATAGKKDKDKLKLVCVP